MKWFKHDSNALHDAKIEKLIMKYGIEGYGLYFACIEIIANELTSENITFELEHDAEILAYKFKIDTLKVEEIMKYCVNLGLFEYNVETKRIVCQKLATRLDISMSQNPEIRKILDIADDNGYVYLFEGDGKYKIGKSKSVERRLNDFQKTLPYDIKLIACIPTKCMSVLESNIHRMFENKRIRGEWYSLDEDDVKQFKTLLAANSRLDKKRLEDNRIHNTKQEKEVDDRLKPYLPLSKLLYTLHIKIDDKYLNNKYLPDIWAKWANDIRLLVEKDGRTISEIEQVIRWVKTEGNFWFVNIMSGKKLRLQFPKLLLQMKQEGKKPGSFKGTDEELHSYDEFFGGNK